MEFAVRQQSPVARRFRAAEGTYTFNQGRIEFTAAGIELVDATREQLELFRTRLKGDQEARVDQILAARPTGADALMRPGSYVALAQSGELDRRIQVLQAIRERDAAGVFNPKRVGPFRIGGHLLNVGEEPAISGLHGTGTVYFGGCHLRCKGCQYYTLAYNPKSGVAETPERLAALFLKYQQRGAHSLQLMTPSHCVVEIAQALQLAAAKGLYIPMVYNSGGHEDPAALAAMEGLVDIYLPDLKAGSAEAGSKFTSTADYQARSQAAIREMYRQVGPLQVDERGIAQRGVLVRHLLLPGGEAEAEQVARFLASVAAGLPVHLMGQWTPNDLTVGTELHRRVTPGEYAAAARAFEGAGLTLIEDERRLKE